MKKIVVYGIREQQPNGSVFMHNTIYRSKAEAVVAADQFMDAFPDIECDVVSFFLI